MCPNGPTCMLSSYISSIKSGVVKLVLSKKVI